MLKISRDVAFKLCIFGDGGVGKTSLTRRFLTRVFDEDIQMTIGADFAVKYLDIEGKKVALRIWDFAGEEQFKILLPGYVSGASGGIFMFDVTRYASILKLGDWLAMFNRGIRGELQIPIIMVGGKCDLEDRRSVSTETAEHIAKSRNLQGYMECSAKTGHNIDEAFETITKEMMKIKGML